ncbi:M48 family metalloprotease, partial [Streptomyces sp. NPDC048057]|uniref:M48 family metalloprotease n=1 Tax=Streptomyces sp. NPDC048057 TaxID=3155628 RepID=UPI0033CE222D
EEVASAPVHPDEGPPPYPGEEVASAPVHPDEGPPPYPGEEVASAPVHPDEELPPYPGEDAPVHLAEEPPVTQPLVPQPIPPPPPLPPAVPVAPGFGTAVDHDDLALDQGRRMVKAVQRGVDGAALSHLLVTVPTGLVSLAVVAFVCALVNPVFGVIGAVAWLLSGPLVFNRSVEAAIARRLLGMRRPTPQEAERLDVVWEQVTRRAGVDRETYELWIQERPELNATAAAGHVVAVTRHAMEWLPNSRLAAVLAHELGHHVGGHTWASMLADWYALPARTAGRAIFAFLTLLFQSKNCFGVACGGCLSLVLVQFLFFFSFMEGMWLLVLLVAVGPLLIAWLHRREEFRADAYAVGLGFGPALEDVLVAEAQATAMTGLPPQGPALTPPAVPPMPPPHPGPYHQPYPPSYPQQHPPPHPGHPGFGPPHAWPHPTPRQPAGAGPRFAARAAHTNMEARLRNVRLVLSQQNRP